MTERIEEYRRDWVADGESYPKAKHKKRFSVYGSRPHLHRFLLLMFLALVAYGCYVRRVQLSKMIDDWISYEKTRTEMVAISRLMQQHIKVNGRLPSDPVDHIRGNMKKTKPAGPTCDFWGRPYHVYLEAQTLLIHSWGADGLEGTNDDIWIRSEVSLSKP